MYHSLKSFIINVWVKNNMLILVINMYAHKKKIWINMELFSLLSSVLFSYFERGCTCILKSSSIPVMWCFMPKYLMKWGGQPFSTVFSQSLRFSSDWNASFFSKHLSILFAELPKSKITWFYKVDDYVEECMCPVMREDFKNHLENRQAKTVDQWFPTLILLEVVLYSNKLVKTLVQIWMILDQSSYMEKGFL